MKVFHSLRYAEQLRVVERKTKSVDTLSRHGDGIYTPKMTERRGDARLNIA